jgi:hypothetical protein
MPTQRIFTSSSSAYLVLFFPRILDKSHVVVHIEIEQWSGLSSRLGDDEIVKRIVLAT